MVSKYGWFYDEVYKQNIYLLPWSDGSSLERFIKHEFNFDWGAGKRYNGRTVEIENPNGSYSYVVATENFKWNNITNILS